MIYDINLVQSTEEGATAGAFVYRDEVGPYNQQQFHFVMVRGNEFLT